MRRKYFGLAIAAIATLGPMQAWGGDREIAEQIIKRLQSNRDSGALRDFTLDMKVDKGVVLFRGNVNGENQKDLVLQTAKDIEGIAKVVDDLTILAAAPAAKTTTPAAKSTSVAQTATPVAETATPVAETATPVAQTTAPVAQATAPAAENNFSLRQALAEEARLMMAEEDAKPVELATTPLSVMPGEVRPATAVELAAPVATSDQKIVSSVIGSLGKAQKAGVLKGFGVDVKSSDGVVWLRGRAASKAQRDRILQIAESAPGVKRVRNSIEIPAQTSAPNLPRLPEPPALNAEQYPRQTPAMVVSSPMEPPVVNAKARLAPVAVDPVNQPARVTNQVPTATAAPMMAQAQGAPYRPAPQFARQPLRAQPVQATIGAPMAAPMMGQPVPMGGGGGVGAPRYDSPNLPNYAWPGYAAHPNYAALTYPQQYSPSAFPYIGPFYPYPQVPLGWRKVTLEWDDGWWALDFTDR